MKTSRLFLLFFSLLFASACLALSRSSLTEEVSTGDQAPAPPERLPGEAPTPTPFPCPAATPEPLWVDPVISPTTLLTQTIVVYIGNGEYVSVSVESGNYTEAGDFGAFNNPANVRIDLLPNTRHQLEVSARVKQVQRNGCVYGGYTLFTDRDRDGNPLVIDHIGFSLYLPFAVRDHLPESP